MNCRIRSGRSRSRRRACSGRPCRRPRPRSPALRRTWAVSGRLRGPGVVLLGAVPRGHQAGEQRGAARRAARRGDEGVGEGDAGPRQPLHLRRANPSIAVGGRIELALIVGKETTMFGGEAAPVGPPAARTPVRQTATSRKGRRVMGLPCRSPRHPPASIDATRAGPWSTFGPARGDARRRRCLRRDRRSGRRAAARSRRYLAEQFPPPVAHRQVGQIVARRSGRDPAGGGRRAGVARRSRALPSSTSCIGTPSSPAPAPARLRRAPAATAPDPSPR